MKPIEQLLYSVACPRHDCQAMRAEVERLRAVLADWLVFANDVGASDAAGHDWLEDLRARSRAVQSPGDGK